MSIRISNAIQAEHLKQFLLKIYYCKKDFELLVIDKMPKTRMGVYIVEKKRIRIYSQWICATPLEEIAIHEYAHHIHETEKRRTSNRRVERAHGPEFWRIYSGLCCKATLLGLYNDELISDFL